MQLAYCKSHQAVKIISQDNVYRFRMHPKGAISKLSQSGMHPYLIFISVIDTSMCKMLAYKYYKTPNYHLHILGEESSADCRQFLNSSRSEDRILPIFKVPSLGRAFNTKPTVRSEGKSHENLTLALHSTFGPRGSARSLSSASPKKYESYQIHLHKQELWYGVTLSYAPAKEVQVNFESKVGLSKFYCR